MRLVPHAIWQVKESAYLTMVRPQLEYASAVWDPTTLEIFQS